MTKFSLCDKLDRFIIKLHDIYNIYVQVENNILNYIIFSG